MSVSSNKLVGTEKWDVALASLVSDEYRKLAVALSIDDFSRLASAHAIRFDDIMETVFSLCINKQWGYVNAAGDAHSITQEEVNRLYIDRRLYEKDLREYKGKWSPLDG